VRLYERLFTHPDPGATTGNWEDDINPDSERIIRDAMVEDSLAAAPNMYTFQAERTGFFVVDVDSDPVSPPAHDGAAEGGGGGRRIVLNRTVTLKESKGAKAVRKA
jgi:glutaminyl-tRNA synthetase